MNGLASMTGVIGAIAACAFAVAQAQEATEPTPVAGWADYSAPAWMATDAAGEVAIGGVDPVSYFDEGAPRRGDSAHRSVYHGAVFLFASAEHKAMFDADPEHYAPAFGGYDPEAVAAGAFEPADPQNWTIIGDRLYLSGSRASAEAFRAHADRTRAAASEVWRMVDDHYEAPRFFNAHEENSAACRTYGESGFRLNCRPAGRLTTDF